MESSQSQAIFLIVLTTSYIGDGMRYMRWYDGCQTRSDNWKFK